MIKSSNLVSTNKVSTTFISEASPEPSCSGLDNSNDNNIDLIEDDIDCGANCSDVLANHEKDFNYTLVSLEPTDIVHDNHNNHKDLENLDKIVTEFKEKEKQIEEKEANTSDGTVDELIREIYEKGGEEVRRAMNKRFNESGAVLNLEEIKNDSEVKNEIDLNNEEVCELTPNLD
jgi:tyrosyl-tRNA synthetase